MKDSWKALAVKVFHAILDGLLFIVPILELTEVMAIIPAEWLPWYMLVTAILRRVVRLIEEKRSVVS